MTKEYNAFCWYDFMETATASTATEYFTCRTIFMSMKYHILGKEAKKYINYFVCTEPEGFSSANYFMEVSS